MTIFVLFVGKTLSTALQAEQCVCICMSAMQPDQEAAFAAGVGL